MNDPSTEEGPKLKLNAAIAWMNFSEDGEQVHVITQDGKATEWDWRTVNEAKSHTPEGQALRDPNSSGTTKAPKGQAPRDPNSSAATNTPEGQALRDLKLSGTTAGFQGLAGARPSNNSFATVFSPDRSRYATLSSDNRIRVHDASTHAPLTPPIDHNPNTGPPAFSANGRYLFTIHPSYAVQVWDLDQRGEPPVLLRPSAPHALAETGREGSAFVTHDPNRPIRVRSMTNATEVSLHSSSLKTPPVQAWFDDTGQFVIIETENQHAQIWDATTGLPVTPRFKSRYAKEDENFRTIKWPPVKPSALIFQPYASLLSCSRLDGTGGWRPLELGRIIERWNALNVGRRTILNSLNP